MPDPTAHCYQMQMELTDFFIRYTETSDLPYFPRGQWLGMQWITLYQTCIFNSAGMAQCILTLMSLKRRERRGEKKKCPGPTSSHLNIISFYAFFISASLFVCLQMNLGLYQTIFQKGVDDNIFYFPLCMLPHQSTANEQKRLLQCSHLRKSWNVSIWAHFWVSFNNQTEQFFFTFPFN